MGNVTLNVNGMSCGHCVKSIEGSVGSLDGVELVKADLVAGKVNVEFNYEKVTLEKIKETIENQGYDVE